VSVVTCRLCCILQDTTLEAGDLQRIQLAQHLPLLPLLLLICGVTSRRLSVAPGPLAEGHAACCSCYKSCILCRNSSNCCILNGTCGCVAPQCSLICRQQRACVSPDQVCKGTSMGHICTRQRRVTQEL
jgi:hypothetical protein